MAAREVAFIEFLRQLADDLKQPGEPPIHTAQRLARDFDVNRRYDKLSARDREAVRQLLLRSRRRDANTLRNAVHLVELGNRRRGRPMKGPDDRPVGFDPDTARSLGRRIPKGSRPRHRSRMRGGGVATLERQATLLAAFAAQPLEVQERWLRDGRHRNPDLRAFLTEHAERYEITERTAYNHWQAIAPQSKEGRSG